MSEPRLTDSSLRVLKAFLEARKFRATGADVINATKQFSGTVYPILYRFEEAGWLKGEWEDIDPRTEGRPKKKFYQLTGKGQRVAHERLRELSLSKTRGLSWAR